MRSVGPPRRCLRFLYTTLVRRNSRPEAGISYAPCELAHQPEDKWMPWSFERRCAVRRRRCCKEGDLAWRVKRWRM